jgi:hypothetical protein
VKQDDKKGDEDREKELARADEEFKNTDLAIARRKQNEELSTILAKADHMELYSLDPRRLDESDAAFKDSFHGYKVLVRLSVESAQQRRELATSLSSALHWNELRKALCFDPGYGLRVVSAKRTVDCVLCFHCSQGRVYEGDNSIGAPVLVGKDWSAAAQLLRDAEKKRPKG